MISRTNMPRVAFAGSVAMILLLASCQGRTAHNMVPKGETVEVVIQQPNDDANNEVSDDKSN
ncbi:MAG: hypothetical protein HDR88_18215 [Bacteroides sp.]|nr:hypothetical protein [Bacteroides sp.]